MYTPAASERTYARLAELTRALLAARYPVIVDAAFLQREQRDRFVALAREAGARFLVAACTAPAQTLRARVAARMREARDASEAGLAVLERQFATAEPLAPDEAGYTMTMDAQHGAGAPEAAALARRLGLEPA
jgi:hypothetical protein